MGVDTVEPIIPPTPAEYRDRIDTARHRLAALLQPKTDEEQAVVRRVGDQLDLRNLMVLVELIGYAHDEDVSS
jgi:hypothetical protein